MMSLTINLLLIVAFTLLVALTIRGRKNVVNALIIFHSLNVVKVLFLCIWVVHKAGWLDVDYIMTGDERYYLLDSLQARTVVNLYRPLVYGLRYIGFSINNIKMLNILISSFAVVRLYTLKDLVQNRRRYVFYLLSFVGILFLHITYLAIFVHKDALFFYVTVEFFILLVKRPIRNRWVLIVLLATLLMLIRRPMFFGFAVFLFDRNWRIRPARVAILLCLILVTAWQYWATCRWYFHSMIAYGLHANLAMGESSSDMKAYAQEGVLNYAGDYRNLVMANLRKATSVAYQTDITYQLMLALEWLTLIYLLVIRRNLVALLRFWPILTLPLVYSIGGILTFYNVRYSVFPMTFVICLSVYVASRPASPLRGLRRHRSR